MQDWAQLGESRAQCKLALPGPRKLHLHLRLHLVIVKYYSVSVHVSAYGGVIDAQYNVNMLERGTVTRNTPGCPLEFNEVAEKS